MTVVPTPTLSPENGETVVPTPPEEELPEQGGEEIPLSGTPTPSPEPTPATGWIEYDDEWWEDQMGDNTGGYDDFYE